MASKQQIACHDTELAGMLEKKDSQLFDRLYEYYWNPLINYSAHYLKDHETCEEIVQDLFVHLHGCQARLKVKSFSSYLFRCLRNKIFNYFRDQALYRKHLFIAAMERNPLPCDAEQQVHFKDLQNVISQVLLRLPPKCREVYVLRYHEQLPLKRMAIVLQRPVNTIEKQLRKANFLLKDELKQVQFIHRLN